MRPSTVFSIMFACSLLFIVIEYLYAKKKRLQIHSWKENLPTAVIFLINLNQATLVSLAIYFIHALSPEIAAFFQKLRPEFVTRIIASVEGTVSFPWLSRGWPRWVCLFLAVDLIYYLSHRLSHTLGILWAGHFVHHSFRAYNILAAHRDPLFFLRLRHFSVLVMLPFFTVFTLAEVTLVYTLISIYSTWLHVSFIPKLPVIDWVFTTPSHHRMHHSLTNPHRTLNVNYGGVLIIWDRLFGTFIEEKKNQHRFGVEGFSDHDRLLAIVFFEWKRIFTRLRIARSAKEVFSILFWSFGSKS